MGELFGTDGVRGVANHHPITPELVLNLGRAAAAVLKHNCRSSIVIGKDGRISGDMIEAALAAGICSAGADVLTAGLVPTPAVAYLVRYAGADAGIMVSASHNPYEDNGIKIFDANGFKLNTATEDEIEDWIRSTPKNSSQTVAPDAVGRVRILEGALDQYGDFLKNSVGNNAVFKGLKVLLDCSNGAVSEIAPHVFAELGAELTVLFDNPNGININENCGSEHIKTLQQVVLQKGADIGCAFDGDGDRLIAVDEKGQAVTGDQILAICARHMKQTGYLKNNQVVSTVMSNLGLRMALEKMGIEHLVTDVGDRYVLDKMRSTGAVIGGEDSGHMIFLDTHSSGDGILTAIKLIQAMIASNSPLSELSGIMHRYPQVLKNVRIREKTDIYQFPKIADIIEKVKNHLGGQGRVLVRYSGTQPLCRIMVEGPDPEETEQLCRNIVDVIASELDGAVQ